MCSAVFYHYSERTCPFLALYYFLRGCDTSLPTLTLLFCHISKWFLFFHFSTQGSLHSNNFISPSFRIASQWGCSLFVFFLSWTVTNLFFSPFLWMQTTIIWDAHTGEAKQQFPFHSGNFCITLVSKIKCSLFCECNLYFFKSLSDRSMSQDFCAVTILSIIACGFILLFRKTELCENVLWKSDWFSERIYTTAVSTMLTDSVVTCVFE